MQRVVTGHSKNGKSIFTSIGEPPCVVRLNSVPGSEAFEVWATEGIPTVPATGDDLTVGLKSFSPGPGGTRLRIARIPSEKEIAQALPGGIDPVAYRQEHIEKLPGIGERLEIEDPGMHTTDSVDYGIVLSGEIWLELDDGAEVHLMPGDCVVQNGTRHAWRNRGSEPCIMAFVMVGAKRVS
jgi:mannose-6-phosphate isomerase-like protein (cupin superfamily)